MEEKKIEVKSNELLQEKMKRYWKNTLIWVFEYVWIWATYSILSWKEFITNKLLSDKSRLLMMWYMSIRGASFYLGSDRVCKVISEGEREELLHANSGYCILYYLMSQWIFIYEKGTRKYDIQDNK